MKRWWNTEGANCRANFLILCLPFWQIHLTIWTNTFWKWDKYISYFGKIYFGGDGCNRWMKRRATTMVEHRGRQLSSQLLIQGKNPGPSHSQNSKLRMSNAKKIPFLYVKKVQNHQWNPQRAALHDALPAAKTDSFLTENLKIWKQWNHFWWCATKKLLHVWNSQKSQFVYLGEHSTKEASFWLLAEWGGDSLLFGQKPKQIRHFFDSFPKFMLAVEKTPCTIS